MDWLDGRGPSAGYVLAAAGFVLAVWQSAIRPLWYDEVMSFHLASLSSFSGLVDALSAAVDTHPPLNYVWIWLAQDLVRPFAEALGPDAVERTATRLPSNIGFAATTALLYRWCRAWMGGMASISSVLFFWIAWGFRFSTEGRSYTLMLVGLGIAMLGFRELARTQSTRGVAVMALGLAFANAHHYLSMLFFVPFGVAELVRTRRIASLDFRVWICFAAAGIPLALMAPIALNASKAYSAGSWAPPAGADFVGAYLAMLMPAWPIIVGAALLTAVVWFLGRNQTASSESSELLSSEERALVWGLLALPAIGVAFAFVATKVFAYRYALPFVPVAASLFGFAVQRKLPGSALRAAVLAGCAALFVTDTLTLPPEHARMKANAQARWDLAFQAKPDGTPIVASAPMSFLEDLQEAPDRLLARMVYVSDIESAREYCYSPSVEININRLARFVDLPIEPLEPFLARHRTFYVWSHPDDRFDWIVPRLEAEGRHLTSLGKAGSRELLRCCD